MSRSNRLLAIVCVALLTTSLFVGVAGAQLDSEPTAPPETADDAFVQDDGSVVLVYESEEELNADARTEYGAEVGSNLLYFLAIEPVEDPGTTAATGDATAVLTDSELTANGTFSAPTPESLNTLSVDISGQSTSENARMDATLATTFSLSAAGPAGLSESATITGNVTTTASTFQTAGSVTAQLRTGSEQSTRMSYTLSESDGDYTLEAEREETLSSFQTGNWESREQAIATIERQFADVAAEFGGSADVTVSTYSFEEQSDGSARLDITYTVQYENIKQGLADTIARDLSESQTVDMSQSEIDSVAERVQQLSLDGASFEMASTGGEITASYNLGLRNYDEAALAALEVATATEDAGASEEQLNRTRAQFEAVRASDLSQRFEWSIEYDQPDSQTGAVDAEFQYRTENHDAYVQELESRDISTSETTYDFTAETNDGIIDAEGSMSVQGESLVDQTVGQLLNASQANPSTDEETVEFLEGMQRADFTRAQTDITLDDENVTVEAGAQFQNLSALGGAVAATGDFPDSVESVVGRTQNDTLHSYVRVQNAVEGDASEDDVRNLAGVDDETDVHMPGDYDREFPEMDTQRAADYLGVEAETGGSGPGFGIVAAVLALLGAALLARRRT